MPFDLGGFGEQVASTGVGTVLGLALEKHNDTRQINQQKALTDIQTNAQENMTDYSYAKQLQMWKDTSYSAQMEQMKKAGINPALMYGEGGGGGTTTGSPGATSAAGGEAPRGGHEIMDVTNQMLAKEQIQLLQAQKENIQADTANKQAGTGKTTAETQNVPLQGKNIEANTANTQADTALTKVNTDIANLEQTYKSATLEQSIANYAEQATKIYAEAKSALAQGNIDAATQENRISQVKANLSATLAGIVLTQAQTELAKSGINLNTEQIANWVQQQKIAWTQLGQTNEWNTIAMQKAAEQELSDYLNLPANTAKDLGEKIIQALTLGGLLKGTPGVQRNPIGYKP